MTRIRITQQLLANRREIELMSHGNLLRLKISRIPHPDSHFGVGYQLAVLNYDEVSELHHNLSEWLGENKPELEEGNPDIRDAQPRG